MAKRPSYKSIRVRQRNIVEGMGTGRLKYKQAADRLGVTESELRRFLDQKPRTIHSNFNRSKSYSRLYESGSRAGVRSAFGLTRVTKYQFREEVLLDPANYIKPRKGIDIQVGRMLQRYYYKNGHERINWSVYTREHNLPNSIKAIKVLYQNGRITPDEYRKTVEFWRDNYHVEDVFAAAYIDWEE